MKHYLITLLLISYGLFTSCLYSQCVIAGPNNPSTFSGNGLPGDQSWFNPDHAADANGVFSSSGFIINVLNIEPTKHLTAKGLNFNIPSNAVIAGIQVDVKRMSSGVNLLATIEDNSVRLIKNNIFVGEDKASSDYWPIFSSSYKTYGGPNDLWGTTWAPADINSPDFGAAVSAKLGGLVSLLPSANIDHIRITINYSLIPSLVCNINNICKGDSTIISASNNTSYSWSPSTGLNTTVGSSVIATPSITTTYTVVGITGNCLTTNTLTIDVKTTPTLTLSSSTTSNTICEGNSINLSVNGATSYTWSPNYGLNLVNSASVTVSPSVTTTYSVIGTAINGCTNKNNVSTYTVNVNSAPQITLNATSNSICNGGNTILAANGANTYTWSPSTGLSAVNDASVIASPSITTVYQVLGSSSDGCASLSPRSVTVTINNAPTLNLSSSATGNKICNGQSTNLIASGASSYTWAPATGLNTTTGANVIANPTTTTIYTVIAVADGGCNLNISPKTITLTVNSTPNISISANSSTICEGKNTIITATGATSYTWLPSNCLSSSAGSSVTASPLVTTNYTVFGTGANGCDNSLNPKTFNITVNNSPKPTINCSSTTNDICAGSSVTLSASGANSYSWSPASSLSSNTGAIVVANPTSTTIYSLSAIGANGCDNFSSPETFTLTLKPVPTLTLSSSDGNYSVCKGGDITLTANGAETFTWSPATTLSSAIGANVIASPSITTVYTVIGESADGCSNANTPQTVTITVNSSPNISLVSNVNGDTICKGNPISLSVIGTATSYTWNTGSFSQSITVTPTTSSVYDVVSTNSSNCSASSSIYVVVIDSSLISLSLQSYSVNTMVNIPVSQNISVGSNAPNIYAITLTKEPNHGTASILNGVISYTPNLNYDGTDTVSYSLCDNYCQNTCRTEKLIIIIDSDVSVPGVLSPNGDGVHDEFYIKGLSKYKETELVVFNRWGDIVYSAKPYQNDWNGQSTNNALKISGNNVLEGTYFYMLTLSPEITPMKGFFELKRK